MKRQSFWFAVALVCVLLVFFAMRVSPRRGSPSRRTNSASSKALATNSEPLAAPTISTSPSNSPDVPFNPAAFIAPSAFETADARQKRTGDADVQLLAVKGMLRDYRAALGENPIGDNSEITRALSGKNPRGARFLAPEAQLNNSRQLIDRWGHPYFFHQISSVNMEVRSAGPDGVMWNADDEVAP